MDENLRQILLGGQSFSWREVDNGVFSAALNGKVYTVSSIDDARQDEFLSSYFDMGYDYDKARLEISKKDPILKEAVEKVGPIRILRQDPWTTTVSFILSQNNNIKRITGLYNKISEKYGHMIEPGWYSFPSADDMRDLTEDDLRALGVGFRAPFIIDAIKNSKLLDEIPSLDFDSAMERLETIKGIGPKVASCILIYGFARREGFPLDVWMKRVMAKYFPGKTPDYFAPNQALSQQYLFSWIREKDS